MKTFNCVKTAVASLLLASAAVAWALPPQYLYGTSTSALESGPIAIATTVPATYVVAAEANASNDLEVIAWHDMGDLKKGGLAPVGSEVVEGPGLHSVGITGLDSSRVVTADIDYSGTLTINTWTVGPAGVVLQKGKSTAANVAYHNVAITTLSPTEVVTAYQLLGAPGVSDSGGSSLAVEEWTIAADGSPAPEGALAILPIAAPDIDEVSIATVNSNLVMTSANDTNNDLLVATWGFNSAGVYYQDGVDFSNTAGTGTENLGIGAGSTFKLGNTPPYLTVVQSAFTPVSYKGQVAVIYWRISAAGSLTQLNIPVWTTTPGDGNSEVAACMVAGKAPITIYGNDDDNDVNLEVFPYASSLDTYNAIKNANQYGITSIAAAAAGDDYSPLLLGTYNGYFVTAVLTHYPAGAPSSFNNNLAIRKWSYPVEPTL